MACTAPLPITHKSAIQALVAAYINLMSQLTAIPALCQHVATVIDTRRQHAPCYLPDMAFNRHNTATRSASTGVEYLEEGGRGTLDTPQSMQV